jgi:ribose transport system permease protein
MNAARYLPDLSLRGLLRSRVIGLVFFDLAFIAAVGAYNPDFARVENFTVIADNMATDAIVLTGTVLLLAAGRFDLSIDGVATMCGIIAGKLMVGVGLSWPLAFALALAVGLLVGFINGFLIEVLGLNPLMTTLGTWWVTAGIALGLTQGFDPTGFPQGFNNLGQARVGGFLISVWYAVALVVVTAVVLSFTRIGAHIFATGGDREAARLNGVKVRRIGVGLYTLSGGLSAFAGIVFAARLSTGTSTAFDGLALSVIAAGVIGGASLAGGRGSVIGGLLGLLLLNMLGNASIYVGISPYWQKGISGVVLLAAVIADVVAERRAKHAGEPRKPWLQELRQRIQAVGEREAVARKEGRVRT